MPRQSSRSLKTARPLTTSPTQNTTTQNQPVPQNHPTNASIARPVRSAVRRGRKLQDGLALANHTHLLAGELLEIRGDRKSTRLNSSHGYISYAVFCLKKKKQGNSAKPHTRP